MTARAAATPIKGVEKEKKQQISPSVMMVLVIGVVFVVYKLLTMGIEGVEDRINSQPVLGNTAGGAAVVSDVSFDSLYPVAVTVDNPVFNGLVMGFNERAFFPPYIEPVQQQVVEVIPEPIQPVVAVAPVEEVEINYLRDRLSSYRLQGIYRTDQSVGADSAFINNKLVAIGDVIKTVHLQADKEGRTFAKLVSVGENWVELAHGSFSEKLVKRQ